MSSAYWPKLLGLLAIVFVGWWVYAHWRDLTGALVLFRRLALPALLWLLFLQLVYTLCLAASNHGIYQALGINTRLWEQTVLILASGVANRLIPLGGASGVGSFVYLAGRQGIPASASLKLTAVSLFLGYLQIAPAAVLVMAWGLAQARASTSPSAIPIYQAAFLALGTVGLALGAVLALSTPYLQQRLAAGSRFRIFRPVLRVIAASHEYAVWIRQHKWQLAGPLLYLLALYPIRLAMLTVCFGGFHYHLGFLPMTIGYIMALLTVYLSFLPTSLGVFEAVLVSAYQSFGVPADVATAITLLYRSYTFWIPIPLGLLAYGFLNKLAAKN